MWRLAILLLLCGQVRLGAQAHSPLEAAAEDIVLADGRYHVRGAPQSAVTLAEIAAAAYSDELPEGVAPGLEATEFWSPPQLVYPFGAHVAVVEVDRETGRVRVRDYVAVDDCGPRLNPMLVAGQVHGGLAQGIAQALWEHLVFGPDGQLLTGSLMDYALPHADDLPAFTVAETVTPSPINPLGAKGIGEAATIGYWDADGENPELAARLGQTGGPVTGRANVDADQRPHGGSYGVHIVDVEVDPETGKVTLLRCTALQDVGRAIHPGQIEGQMKGGTVQGIGWALFEGYQYGADGSLRNANLLDYKLPTALDVPAVEPEIVEVPDPTHPFGVRGAGETPILPPPAAIANAIYRAVGVRLEALPMTPAHILERMGVIEG